jgi:hypothetical protein
MRILAVFAALAPLLTLPALADRAAVDKCQADADKIIASLNEQMRMGQTDSEGDQLLRQHAEATAKRAACEKI